MFSRYDRLGLLERFRQTIQSHR